MSVVLSDQLAGLLAQGEPAILATIAEAQGSTPRETGAAMLVAAGACHGTIGGGQLEYLAIDTARVMLALGEEGRELDLPLGPLLGQCCGGRVRVSLERAGPEHIRHLRRGEEAERRCAPAVLVFGCGHTGRALAQALAPLPVQTGLVDDRLEAGHDLPAGIALLRLDDPAEAVAAAPLGAAFIILTHSHALDYRLADAALRRGDAAYVGMIGSATKRARFARFFLQGGGSPEALARLTCPIGGADVPDKRPAVIAALTAAELIRVFARFHAGGPARSPAMHVEVLWLSDIGLDPHPGSRLRRDSALPARGRANPAR
jgi:xanthine dehydrogenase accessory protein XdhC